MSNYTIEKDWEVEDLRCVVIMGSMGHRCGYVGVPKGHPLYGADYHKHSEALKSLLEKVKNEPFGKRGILAAICWDGEKASPEVIFNVHGGLTYSGGGDYPVTSELYWFGYDCGHYDDAKDLSAMSGELKAVYTRLSQHGEVRGLEYCVGECESLAKQLKEVV